MGTGYLVIIKAGNGDYGAKVGWDTVFASRGEAEACAERAGNVSGWSAKVVEAPLSEYRAYDTTTEWMGKIRNTREEAQRDADRHDKGCEDQGGYGSAIVVMQDPRAEGRCVSADTGKPVWPPHGRSTGSVRWR